MLHSFSYYLLENACIVDLTTIINVNNFVILSDVAHYLIFRHL